MFGSTKTKLLAFVAALNLGLFAPLVAIADGQVNVYSARKEALIKPLLDRFSEETGIEVRLLTGKADGLLQRLRVEGRASPADMFITVDAGRLHLAKAMGLFQAIDNTALNEAIPANLRDPDGAWFGLSLRARPIFYSRDRVDPASISRYEDLANPEWQGRLCLRSSDAVYNQSLVASKLAASGEEETQQWISGMVANLARKPAGGDTEQLRFLANHECDLTIANTYYYGRLMASSDASDREISELIGIIWPNQNDRGTHVNVSGAGVLKSSRNKANAEKLLAFLVSPESQAWYAEVNNEYPVRKDVAPAERLRAWGTFKPDSVNLQLLGELNADAVRSMDKAGWR